MIKDDKFMATVKIGPKGQIIIPKDVRQMFGLSAGDSILMLADKEHGIALQRVDYMMNFMDAVFNGQKDKLMPETTDEEDKEFVDILKKEIERSPDDESSEG